MRWGLILLFLSIEIVSGQATVLSDCSFTALETAIQAGGDILLSCGAPIFFEHPITVRTNVSLSGSVITTLSGSNAVQLFLIEENVEMRLTNLLIRDGYASAPTNPNANNGNSTQNIADGTNVYGGAIWNRGGTLILHNCTFASNVARGGDGGPGWSTQGSGYGGDALGGAIMSSNGFVRIESCAFQSNSVLGGTGGRPISANGVGRGGNVSGGAIHQVGGDLFIEGTTFESNVATPGNIYPYSAVRGAALVIGRGGAVVADHTRLRVSECLFLTNSVTNAQASAVGGAIYATSSTNVYIVNTDFHGNSALAGLDSFYAVGNARALGGAAYLTGCVAVIDSCFWSGNSAIGGTVHTQPYSNGTVDSYGGAFVNEGTVSIRKSSFFTNVCTGARAGMTFQTLPDQPGSGYGGAIYNSREMVVENSTFAFNSAFGGLAPDAAPYSSWPSTGAGGAVGNAGTASFAHCTFASNSAVSFGTNRLFSPSPGGSVWNNGTLNLEKSILAYSNANNFDGPVTDGGENLSSDSTPNFIQASSRNRIDPLLAPFRYYLGKTPTMALRFGSPALDAASSSAQYSTDQRDQPRPYGPSADIGAYEVTLMPTNSVLAARPADSEVVLSVFSNPSDNYEVLSSTNLVYWQAVLTNHTDNLGRLQLKVSLPFQSNFQFFKARHASVIAPASLLSQGRAD